MTSAAGPPGLSTTSPKRLRPRSHPANSPGLADRGRQAGLATDDRRTETGADESGPDVSVVVPTYNEADNIKPLLDRLGVALDAMTYEIVVVDDDSEDGTWRVAERIAMTDTRINVVRRIGERGLSSAVLAGMAVARGRSLVVIDGDLQHDETKIPELVGSILDGSADIALGSREVDGGSYGSFRRHRKLVSWTGAALARQLLGLPISDPMSGYFAVSRERFELLADDVNPRGFKILLEFLARGPKPRVDEVGYEFGERINGTTKLTSSVAVAYLVALSSLMAQRVRRRLRPSTHEETPVAGGATPDDR